MGFHVRIDNLTLLKIHKIVVFLAGNCSVAYIQDWERVVANAGK